MLALAIFTAPGCSPPTAADTPPVLPVDTGLDTGLGCSPGAVDAPYDGFDADCDGADDFDADRDGFRPPAFGGTDCNDADPAIYVGAPRVCGDEIDNDCDGVEECGLQGIVVLEDVFAARFDGTEGSAAGWHLRTGDVNGDGYADLLSMGEYVYTGWLFLGPLTDSRSADQADAEYPGSGWLAAMGDLDGDGLDDVATAIDSWDGTWVRAWAATTPSGAAPDAESDFTSAEAIAPFAVELGDTSGDGLADLLLAHLGGDGWEDEPGGTIPIWNSPLPATFGADDIDALLLGGPNIGSVSELDAKSDLTGDGLTDVVVAVLGQQNEAYVVESPVAGTILLEDQPAQVVEDEALGSDLSAAVTADLDGDGTADLVTGWGTSGYPIGEAWVHHGPFSAVASRGEAAAIVTGVHPLSLAAPGDLDGDGQADLVVESYAMGLLDGISAQATIVYGPQGLEAGDAFVVPAGSPKDPEGTGGACGIYSVASVGDVDLDGLADFATGSPGCVLPDLMVSSGTAMVILGAATGF